MNIPIIGRAVTIWDELLFKLKVTFGGLVIRKKLLSGYNHCIETHIYVVVEVLEVHISLSFEFCIDEEFVDFC